MNLDVTKVDKLSIWIDMKPSTVPSGSFLKASSVGANTVSRPPLKVSASPAAVTAATKVFKNQNVINLYGNYYLVM